MGCQRRAQSFAVKAARRSACFCFSQESLTDVLNTRVMDRELWQEFNVSTIKLGSYLLDQRGLQRNSNKACCRGMVPGTGGPGGDELESSRCHHPALALTIANALHERWTFQVQAKHMAGKCWIAILAGEMIALLAVNPPPGK